MADPPPTTALIPAWLTREARCLGELRPRAGPPPLRPPAIRAALLHPVGLPDGPRSGLAAIRPRNSVCVVLCDYTRRSGADQVLPALMAELSRRGCRPEDVFMLVASGIHRPTTDDELRRIVGQPIYEAFRRRIFQHDPDDPRGLVDVGVTRRGQAVRVNARFMAAAHRLLIGTVTYHYHAGFGGGRKLIVPGLASRETIAFNHSLSLDPRYRRLHPGAAPGVLDGNPVSEAMLEAARLCGPVFLINTVLNREGRLAGLWTGDLDAAHRAACRQFETMARVEIAERADLAVAWALDAPNWIQAHKALFNAHRAVRPGGGQVVLVAPCPEGLGNERFRHWVRRRRLTELYRELRASPEVNGQTALSTRWRGRQAVLVTNLSERDRADLGLRTAPDLEAALRVALTTLRRGPGRPRVPTFYLMPEAAHTVPFDAAAPASSRAP